MEFTDRHLILPRTVPPEANGVQEFLQNVVRRIFWSPVILLTALVHVLCRPFIRKCLFAVVILDIPLQWGTHLDLRPDAASFGAIEGFDCSITSVALCGLYIGWLFGERAANRPLRILWNWPIAAYTAVLIASAFVAGDVQLSLFQIFLMTEMLFLYICVAGTINSRSEIEFILFLLLAGGLAESVYMLVVASVGHEFAFVRALGIKTVIFLPMRPGEFTRPGGTIGGPNYAAAYLGVLITLAIAIRQMNVSSLLRRLTIPMIILAALALAVTFSRGGWLELLLSVTIVIGARWTRDGVPRKAILTAVAATTLIVLCLIIPNPISQRLSADDNGAAHSRVPLMHLAFRVIAANPVLGVGANNFTAVMDDYAGSEFRREWIYTVHNEFLLVCSETGVLGLAAYLWIYYSIIRRAWRLWKTRDEMFAALGLGIVASFCGLLFHMFVDIFSDGGLLHLIWLFAALIGVCEVIQQRELLEKGPLRTIEVRSR
jgi:putative inorganic carbon (HCO3(-)) transporter